MTRLLILLFNFILFISCSKKEDKVLPVVEIFNPVNNQGFEAGDTVLVYSIVTDDESIRSIVISLKNEADVPVASKSINITGNHYEGSEKLPIPVDCKAGRYYLDVTAFDAYDFTSAYRYLQVGDVLPAVQRVLVFSNVGNQTDVYEVEDSLFNFIKSLDGDFLESVVSRNGDITWSAGRFNGDLNAMNSQAVHLWKYESAALPTVPFFSDIHAGGNVLLVSLNDGRLLSFLNSGQKETEFELEANHFAESIFIHGDRIVSAEYHKPNGQRRVCIYYYPSGIRRDYTVLNLGSVIGISATDWNKILLFCTKSGLNTVAELNTENMSIHSQAEMDGQGPIMAFTEADGRYFIATSSDVFEYDKDLKDFRFFASVTSVTTLRYDKLTNELWLAGGKLIRVYDAGTAHLLRSYSASFEINSLELLR